MTASMVASACFIGLAVWGWDLPIDTVLAFFAICIVFLVVIVLLAAGLGWLLHRWRNRPVQDRNSSNFPDG